MDKSSEYLLEFSALIDNTYTHQTHVRIVTTDTSYTDVWEYTIADDGSRVYSNNIMQFCKDKNINPVWYIYGNKAVRDYKRLFRLDDD